MAVDNRLAYLTDITGGIDSGATVPGSPTDGQLFLHTPTNRKILMVYDSTSASWKPIYAVGVTNIYVDGTNGTDDIDKGGGGGTSAFATIQYAVDQTPPLFSGNVLIHVAAGTYTEDVVVRGKKPVGNYTYSIGGTLGAATITPTINSGVQGTGATPGSITKTSAGWTVNAYQHMLIYCDTGVCAGEWHLIESNTADTITIVGTFDAGAPVNGDTFSVHDYPVNVYSINAYGCKMNAYHIKFTGGSTNTPVAADEGGYFLLERSYVDSDSGSNYLLDAVNLSFLETLQVFVDASGTNRGGVRVNNVGAAKIVETKFLATGSSRDGLISQSNSALNIRDGCIIDNFASGVACETNSSVSFSTGVGGGYHFIQNNTNGIYAYTGGQVGGTANIQYSSNGTNENAVSASYGYID